MQPSEQIVDENSADRSEQRWAASTLAIGRADRSAAEAAVASLYPALGYDAPGQVVWVDGPLQLAREREGSWTQMRVGPNIVHAINNKLADANCTFNRTVRDHPLYWRRHKLLNTYGNLWSAASNLIDQDTGGLRIGPASRLGAWLSGSSRPSNWRTVGTGSRSQFDALYICSQEHLYSRHGILASAANVLRDLARLVTASGWIVPHQYTCWLSERPEVLKVDPRGRLHCADGPALRYADGWEIHAWKGVRASPDLVEQPESITVARIDRERDPVLRRCMIEMMTPATYVALGGARIVARDDVGVLWQKSWAPDTWAAVEVTNGTPEPDGAYKQYFLQVPPEMRTPRQAVAWTYGMSEPEYRNISIRT